MIVPGCLWCEIDSRSKSTWRTSCFTSLGRNLRNPLGSSNETRKPEQFYIIARILTLQICLRKVACLLRFFRMREKPTGSWLDKREEKYESNLANEVFPLFFFCEKLEFWRYLPGKSNVRPLCKTLETFLQRRTIFSKRR